MDYRLLSNMDLQKLAKNVKKDIANKKADKNRANLKLVEKK